MNLQKSALSIALLTTLVTTHAMAEVHKNESTASLTRVALNYESIDLDDNSFDVTGISVKGSAMFADRWFVEGEYGNYEFDGVAVDVDFIRGGLGRATFYEKQAVTLSAGIGKAEAQGCGGSFCVSDTQDFWYLETSYLYMGDNFETQLALFSNFYEKEAEIGGSITISYVYDGFGLGGFYKVDESQSGFGATVTYRF